MKRIIENLQSLFLFGALIVLAFFWREEWKQWDKLPMGKPGRKRP